MKLLPQRKGSNRRRLPSRNDRLNRTISGPSLGNDSPRRARFICPTPRPEVPIERFAGRPRDLPPAERFSSEGRMDSLDLHSLTTSWGHFGYVTRGGHLLATYLPQARRSLEARMASDFPIARRVDRGPAVFERDVRRYFSGERVAFTIPVDLTEAPPFRRKVLEACRRIPYGQTASYADLARTAGKARAVRAAGGAMAHNPLPLIIPCHRVLRSDGSIGGFSSPSGVDEKLHMLQLEGVVLNDRRMVDLRRAV